MKIIVLTLLLFQLDISTARGNSGFEISPPNPEIGQNITVKIWEGFSLCNPLILNQDGTLKKNIIREGNRVKLLTYYEFKYHCAPIIFVPTITYQLGDLGLPVGDYILELYTLTDDVPFPLPQGYDLNLQAELQFRIRAPIIIDSSSKLSLSILVILMLCIGLIGNRNYW